MANNTILLVTIDKFDPNALPVNINKLKPYRFIEDKTLQPVLVKPSDLVIDELVQTREPNSLPIKLEGFSPVKFELVCNYLTLSNIERTLDNIVII